MHQRQEVDLHPAHSSKHALAEYEHCFVLLTLIQDIKLYFEIYFNKCV